MDHSASVAAIGTLADRILAPLAGRSDADWAHASEGRWSPGQIVNHLALAIDLSGKGFASRIDKPPMRRRPATPAELAARLLVLRLGWFPVRRRAPATTTPEPQPDRTATERLLREAVARFAGAADTLLPSRAHDLFLKHPVLGDLNYPEWCRFHERHAAHHLKQLRSRLP